MKDAVISDSSGQSCDVLFQQVYARLKAMAGRLRARSSPATMATTEIVHEIYLRMTGAKAVRFEEQVQFFAYAARAMRHLMLDLARRRLQIKSGGNQLRISITDPAVDSAAIDAAQAIEIDSALRALEADDPQAALVVELHHFAGIALAQVAEITGRSPRSVDRDWSYARRFLVVHLKH